MIESFTASTQTIDPGQTVSLDWTLKGDEPIQLELDGAPIPSDQRRLEAVPVETHTFRLTARNEFGVDSAEVRVRVVEPGDGIFPDRAEVDPGERQRFHATRQGSGQWTASCGSIDGEQAGSIVWRAPAEPSTCRVELEYGDGTLATATITVASASPTVTGVEGLSGSPWTLPVTFTRGPDGTFYLPGEGFPLEYAPGASTWRASLEAPPLSVTRLITGSDGVVHALGTFASQPGRWYAAWLRKAPGSSRWVSAPAPAMAESAGTRFASFGAAAGPDGRVCLSAHTPDYNEPIYCTQAGVEWVHLLDAGATAPWTMGFAPDGTLRYLNPAGEAYVVEDGLPVRFGSLPVPRPAVLVTLGGALYATGDGVFRFDEDAGDWSDLSEGLPRCGANGFCAVYAVVSVDGDLFALTGDGLYGKAPGGVFQRIGDLPPARRGVFFRDELLSSGSDLWFADEEGLWRTDPWTGVWTSETLGGIGFGAEPTAIAFLPDGAIAFGGKRLDEGETLYMLRPGENRWKALGPGPLPNDHTATGLAVREDGALAIGTNRGSRGDGATGRIFFAAPGGQSFEPLVQDGLPTWTSPGQEEGTRLRAMGWTRDGSLLTAIDDEGVFRLAPGAQAWELLGPRLRVNDLLIVGERILVATRGGVVELGGDGSTWQPVGVPRFRAAWDAADHLALGGDAAGRLWVATTMGVFALDDGEWTPAGMGECSATSLGVHAGGGRVYCSSTGGLAELEGGRWKRIPGIGPEGRTAKAIGAGPDGSLYLGFGSIVAGSLVRTQP